MSVCCFARNITFPQLNDYVMSLPFDVRWVESYNPVYCSVDAHVKEVVFVQMAPDINLLFQLLDRKIKVWILNTEQLSRLTHKTEEKTDAVAFHFEEWLLCYIRPQRRVSIMDYSAANIQIWKKLFPDLECKLVPYIPLPLFGVQLNPSPDLSSQPVAFVGDTNSSYRQEILESLGDKVKVISSTFGARRDHMLSQAQILLNIHFGPSYTIFEELRCLPCVLRKMIVVSERSQFPKDHPLYPFIIFVPYQRLAQAVQGAITHYDALFAKLYTNNPKYNSLMEDIKTYAQITNAKLEV